MAIESEGSFRDRLITTTDLIQVGRKLAKDNEQAEWFNNQEPDQSTTSFLPSLARRTRQLLTTDPDFLIKFFSDDGLNFPNYSMLGYFLGTLAAGDLNFTPTSEPIKEDFQEVINLYYRSHNLKPRPIFLVPPENFSGKRGFDVDGWLTSFVFAQRANRLPNVIESEMFLIGVPPIKEFSEQSDKKDS